MTIKEMQHSAKQARLIVIIYLGVAKHPQHNASVTSVVMQNAAFSISKLINNLRH
jgi:hypothetical protein